MNHQTQGEPASEPWIQGDPVSAVVPTRDGPVPMRRFLLDCAAATVDTLTAEQKAFLYAGHRALVAGEQWVQLGLTVGGRPGAQLYHELAEVARDLLAERVATEFFFMHKPPGLRIRFEPGRGQRDNLAATVLAAAERWRSAGLVETATPTVYEPETALFGGPESMRHVHRLFTVDSLRWLDRHASQDPPAGQDAPAWAHSLSVLGSLLAGLGIVGWEDLDVWDQVRTRTGRRLPSRVRESAEFRSAADGIRATWTRSRDGRAHDEIRVVAADWRTGYFDTAAAELGPREAAAFVTIFHWNRGRLDPLRQGLLAEALADRAALTYAAPPAASAEAPTGAAVTP